MASDQPRLPGMPLSTKARVKDNPEDRMAELERLFMVCGGVRAVKI